MSYIIIPSVPATKKMLDETAASGRIIADTSALTLAVGVRKGAEIENVRLFDYLDDSIKKNWGYTGLVYAQKQYIDHLTSLSDSRRLIVLDDMLSTEISGLKKKSDAYILSLTDPRHIQNIGEIKLSIDNLLISLQKNAINPSSPEFLAVHDEVNKIRVYYACDEKKPPSFMDRKLVAAAFYLSVANNEQINILTNDGHVHDLGMLHQVNNTYKKDPLELDVSCFSFSNKHNMELIEAWSKANFMYKKYFDFLNEITEGALF